MEDNTMIQDGDKISALTAIENLKRPLFNLIKTYPSYFSYGIIETYFKGELGKKVVKILDEDKIIKRIPIKEVERLIKEMTPEDLKKLSKGKERFIWYRFTPRGIEFIISLINLDHSQRTARYSKETYKFNKRIIFLTIGLFTIGIIQLILIYVQNPLFSSETFFKILKILYYLN